MKLTRIINKFFAYLYFLTKYLSHSVAFAFANNNVPLRATTFVHRRGKTLVFDENPKNIFPIRLINSFNYPQLNYVVKLLNHRKILLTKAEKGKLVIEFNNIKYNINSPANLTTIDEMLLENVYNVSVTEPCVVLDIGMNVGYASLYFSSISNVKKIYAFEPFGDTFLIAQQNIVVNESFSKKIQSHNYGISNYTGTIDVPLLEAGSIAASTEKSHIKSQNFQSARTISVNVRDILDVLKDIRGDNPRMKIGLKIDCEGEEYNILEAMHAQNGFEQVVFLCIEWHFKGQDRIKEILTSNNFIVFDNPKILTGEYGLIYGFRTIPS